MEKKPQSKKRDWHKAIQSAQSKSEQFDEDEEEYANDPNLRDLEKPKSSSYNIFLNFIIVFTMTVVLTIFSHKFYGYYGGYSYIENTVLMILPVFLFMYLVAGLKNIRITQLILCGAILGFIIEGIISYSMYIEGNFQAHLLSISYKPFWHCLISVLFGFYYLPKSLKQEKWVRSIALTLGFGIYWGIWAFTYSLPYKVTTDENAWMANGLSIGDFTLYTLFQTLSIILGYFFNNMLSQRNPFRPKQLFVNITIAGLAIMWFIFQFILYSDIYNIGLVNLKLILMLAISVFPLILSRNWIGGSLIGKDSEKDSKKSKKDSRISELDDFIPLEMYLAILGIPIGAIATYAIALAIPFSPSFLEIFDLVILYGQSYGMLLVFLIAVVYEWIQAIKTIKKYG